MKPVLATLTAIAIAATVFGSSRLLATPASAAAVAKQQSGFKLLPPAAPAGQMTLYGHVKTITRYVDAMTYLALATIRGGEVVSADAF